MSHKVALEEGTGFDMIVFRKWLHPENLDLKL